VLAGMDQQFATEVSRVRNALDERLERSILKSEVASKMQATAFRHARTFDFEKLRLLHLLNESDSGTASDPLKAFGDMSWAHAAHKLSSCIDRLNKLMLFSCPQKAASAQTFFIELKDTIVDGLERGVSNAEASEFYRATIAKVTAPIRQYMVGASSVASGAVFDTDFISGQSKALKRFERAIDDSRVDQRVDQRQGTKRQVPVDGETAKQKRARLQKEKQAKATATPKATNTPDGRQQRSPDNQKLKDHNEKAGRRAPGVSDGAAVKLPRDLKDFNKAHPPVTFGKRSVRQCFDFHHSQGCDHGAACRFCHGS
jgi:hypothetical protein